MMRPRLLAVAAAAVLAVGCGQRDGARVDISAAVTQPPTSEATDPSDVAPASATPGVPPDSEQSPAASPEPEATPAAAPSPSATAPEARPRAPEQAKDPGARLWGRTWASVSVQRDGRPHELVDDSVLRIQAAREQDRQGIRYSAGCNTGGASLRITSDRLLVGDDGAASAMGCGDEMEAQEDWFFSFVHTSPHWSLAADGERLTLKTGDTVIVFEERAWPPWSGG